MTGFFSQLESIARARGSLLCVGLDPHPSELSENSASAARDFCLRLIDATADLAIAYKPNAAFFETHGADGWRALADVIAAVPDRLPVVLDAKRGDIASTAEAYAQAAFEGLGVDAITLSPYLGYDSLVPFLENPARGAFVLCRTSNPGGEDVQTLRVWNGRSVRPVFEKVAESAVTWNTKDNLGLVVGATFPEALRVVRSIAPDLWILAPGVGAQGGDLVAALRAGLRQDGLGLLLPVSRALSRSNDPRETAQRLIDTVRVEQARIAATPESRKVGFAFAELADGLLDAGCVRFGSFTLKSGLQSPIYLDLRLLASSPSLLAQAGRAYADILARIDGGKRIAALPYAALPIGTAISLQTGVPMIYPRKEVKAYGTRVVIEGHYEAGERVVVIDDLATTGSSKFEAIEKLTGAGLEVRDVVVLIDRQSGARDALAEAGIRLHSVMNLSELLDHWEETGKVPQDQIEASRSFLGQ